MKRLIVLSAIMAFAIMAPSVFAQEHDHGEFGVYGDYFRLSEAGNGSFEGFGGRIGFNVAPRVQLEGQMTYDFEQSFTVTNPSSFTTTVSRSSLNLLHGLFGPKFVFGTDHARLFGTAQGGFMRIGASNGSVVNGFTNSIGAFGDTATHGAFYPGGGGEFYVGPIGLRLDVGDFLYWSNGVHQNLSVRFGPQIKF